MMGGNMKKSAKRLLPAVLPVLLIAGVCAHCASASSSLVPDQLFLEEMLAEGIGYPPYTLEVSVASVHGPARAGTQDLLRDYLRENLKALGDLKFVDGLSAEKQPAKLRVRVWFTQLEEPTEYECFDTTLVVTVGKIRKDDTRYEAILDAYALAGVAVRDLERMCNKIAMRFDLKILSILRKAHQATKQP